MGPQNQRLLEMVGILSERHVFVVEGPRPTSTYLGLVVGISFSFLFT